MTEHRETLILKALMWLFENHKITDETSIYLIQALRKELGLPYEEEWFSNYDPA